MHLSFPITKKGKSIRFSETDVRPMGRAAAGVKAMNISEDDEIVGMEIVELGKEILTVTEKGFGKRTLFDEYRIQRRGGSGIINYKVTKKTGKVVAAKSVDDANELIMISSDGTIIRTKIGTISKTGRSAQGVTLMKLSDEHVIMSIEKIVSYDDVEENEDGIDE